MNQAYELTKREYEVLSLVGQGLRNKEIANLLDCSQRTVETFISTLFLKLQTNSRCKLAIIFLKEDNSFSIKQSVGAKNKIIKLYNSGLEPNQIAKRLGYNKRYVYQVAKGYR